MKKIMIIDGGPRRKFNTASMQVGTWQKAFEQNYAHPYNFSIARCV